MFAISRTGTYISVESLVDRCAHRRNGTEERQWARGIKCHDVDTAQDVERMLRQANAQTIAEMEFTLRKVENSYLWWVEIERLVPAHETGKMF